MDRGFQCSTFLVVWTQYQLQSVTGDNTIPCYWPNLHTSLHECLSLSNYKCNNSTVVSALNKAFHSACAVIHLNVLFFFCFFLGTSALTPLLVDTDRQDQTGDGEEGTHCFSYQMKLLLHVNM